MISIKIIKITGARYYKNIISSRDKELIKRIKSGKYSIYKAKINPKLKIDKDFAKDVKIDFLFQGYLSNLKTARQKA